MFHGSIQELIDAFGRLPGIGPKSAQRIAFYLLNADESESRALAQTIVQASKTVQECEVCFNLATAKQCSICQDVNRDEHIICVVEDFRDVAAIESTGEFGGRYHVLGGVLNPMRGVGPEQLRIGQLMQRLAACEVNEVIVCTNPNVEGETTSMYLARQLQPVPDLKVTRIASGVPMGSDLQHADSVTLGKALLERRPIKTD